MGNERILLQVNTGRRLQEKKAARLGLNTRAYLDKQGALLRRNCAVVDVWEEVLPTNLYEHCRLSGISGGVLRIETEPGPYMHQMSMVRDELLEHIQNRCRASGIKKIAIVAGRGARRTFAGRRDEKP
ncbi:MAG TPA: DUF721 domain-containing protein [Planctomycetes bacterium]|nr:DUF721 domain-containing protein [Planctomycetota bacterium]